MRRECLIPVNGGAFAALVRGLLTTKRVFPTRRSVSASLDGWSNGSTAGCSPAMYRIQAAWRASTEWMPTAAASTSGDSILGAWPL